MKRIIKRYDQYIKESIEDIDNIDEIPSNEVDVENPVIHDEMPGDDEKPSEITDSDEEAEEEEGHQYNGNKMLAELADKLGTDVINNSVEYNGKKINFFSETEMYHVDRKKFKTADEVVEYLNSESNVEEPSSNFGDVHQEEEELAMQESKSYRRTRTFESFKKK